MIYAALLKQWWIRQVSHQHLKHMLHFHLVQVVSWGFPIFLLKGDKWGGPSDGTINPEVPCHRTIKKLPCSHTTSTEFYNPLPTTVRSQSVQYYIPNEHETIDQPIFRWSLNLFHCFYKIK